MDADRRAPEPQTQLKGLTVGEQIEKLAQFIARTGWDDMPEAVHRRAKLVLLDTIAVTLAGAARPEVIELRKRLMAGAGRGATILADGLPQTDTRTAALLNGIAARSVELCEGVRGLQPAPHILPGVLAIAEQRGLGGRAMLGAFVLGYEVAGRLNRGYVQRVVSHPNGQLSLLGAAAGGARLHGLDGAGVSLAMRIATSMLMTASYNNTVMGGTTLNLPGGLGAVAATLAPEMAAAGYTALDDAIEEAPGMMVSAGFEPAKLTDDMGRRWEILENYFRFYACCNPIHAALDSLAETLAVLKPKPEEVALIDVQTFAFASVMRNPAPPNYFASKYSLPHAAAVLIARGGLGFADIDDSALEDPVIARLRPLVRISEDPAMTARSTPTLRPARVTLTLKDGRSATAAREASVRDTLKPDPEAPVRAKYRELAASHLTPAGIDAIEAVVDRCEDWKTMGELIEPLRMHAS
ncbi:2-methylcitrate dehydratase PrpD [Rhodospirillales bacterium URHD0017]|nr:2-methylcitrate dehydratase PrpD [Rhodospirillales bacterium URHD0017]